MTHSLKINYIAFFILAFTACAPIQSSPPTPQSLTAPTAQAVTPAPTATLAPTAQPQTIISLRSPEVSQGGALPREYTCDGASSTLPLEWSGAPSETKSFAVVMHHIPPAPEPAHWYWVVYSIPPSVTRLPKNVQGVGILGNNSVNRKLEYTPPCSKGPGTKIYTYTVYALSADPMISVPASQVNRDVLLATIRNITLASAQLNVTYSR